MSRLKVVTFQRWWNSRWRLIEKAVEADESQVLFKTEWHKPNDGEGEAVLARIVTHKMEDISGVLETLVPNPKFVKQSWRSLRGHVSVGAAAYTAIMRCR